MKELEKFYFEDAVAAMRLGKAVRIARWADDVRIRIQVPDSGSKMTAPYFYVTSRFGMIPWIPTMIEMLTEEWEIGEA